jgi:hypothetical protein
MCTMAVIMRRVLSLLVVVACGHGPPARPPANAAPEVQVPAETLPACAADGNISARGAASEGIPVLVLFERDAWQSGFDVVSLVVWSDGTVAWKQGKPDALPTLLRATVARDAIAQLVDRMLGHLRTAPASTSLSNATDGPTVQVVVRDGESWRVAEVYGLTHATPSSSVTPEAQPLFAAYHELLAWIPKQGEPLPQDAPRPERWPEELPVYRGQRVIDRVVHCSYARE